MQRSVPLTPRAHSRVTGERKAIWTESVPMERAARKKFQRIGCAYRFVHRCAEKFLAVGDVNEVEPVVFSGDFSGDEGFEGADSLQVGRSLYECALLLHRIGKGDCDGLLCGRGPDAADAERNLQDGVCSHRLFIE